MKVERNPKAERGEIVYYEWFVYNEKGEVIHEAVTYAEAMGYVTLHELQKEDNSQQPMFQQGDGGKVFRNDEEHSKTISDIFKDTKEVNMDNVFKRLFNRG